MHFFPINTPPIDQNTSQFVAQWKNSLMELPRNFADSETPSGTVDGYNATFTLEYAPSPTASLRLYKNGLLLRQGTDYTLKSKTITYSDAPAETAWHLAFYRY